ncbi:unnamed protein product [Closterium sp. Naga37s-1]|nr:unnamed protein product [Closterium sp. Naga37s-1]
MQPASRPIRSSPDGPNIFTLASCHAHPPLPPNPRFPSSILPTSSSNLPHPLLPLPGQSEAALTVYQRMLKAGCKPNTFTLASLIRILGKTKDWQGAVKFFEDARSSSIPLNAHLFNALLDALLHNRQVAAARLYRGPYCRTINGALECFAAAFP